MKRILATTLAIMLMATSSVSALAVDLTDSPATNNAAGDYAIGVDGTYAAGTPAQDVISVDIAWGSMNFTYTDGSAGIWNPETHAYVGATQGTWSTDKAGITVANHSNVGIEADFSFAAADGVTTTGTFYTQKADNSYTALSADAQLLSLATAVGTDRASAPSGAIYFGVSGDPISENKSLGTITVKIAKDEKIYTGAALQAALATLGTTGGTITLGADITLPIYSESGLNGCFVGVENGKHLVIDLNGHTVTGILEAAKYNGDGTAQLTIKNGTINYTASPAEAGAVTGYVINTLLDKVNITASGVAAVLNMSAAMRITDCTLNGGIEIDTNTVTVANNQGMLTLAGKTFIDPNGSILNINGIVKVEAGTYNFDPTAYVDADSYTVTANTDGTWTVSVKTA